MGRGASAQGTGEQRVTDTAGHAASHAPRPTPHAPRPWRYWGFRAALALARLLPRRLGYPLAALGGELYFRLNPGHGRKAIDNYAVLLADHPGAPRVRGTARRSFRNYGKVLFDFFRLPALDPDALEADVIGAGWEHLDAALAWGRGVVLVSPHLGNWDLAAAIVAARGYRISAVADRFSPPAVDHLIHATRNRTGLGIIPLDPGGGALRRITAHLRAGQIVGFVFDRPQREGGVEVEFFGAPAWLPAGPARFALRAGAPVVGGHVIRRPGDRTYFGRFDPIPFTPTGDEAADIQALTQAIVRWMEGVLRQHPDQWYMFRRMWPEATAECGVGDA